MNAKSKKQNLVVTRTIQAPIEQVWKAWSSPEYVKKWWGPNGFICPMAQMNFREGGTSLVCMRAPKEFGGQDMYNTWTYEKIVPMKQIIYILRFSDKNGNTIEPTAQGLPSEMSKEVRNEVIFKNIGNGKTELTITEYDWAVGQMMEMSKVGLEQCLDKMAKIFAE